MGGKLVEIGDDFGMQFALLCELLIASVAKHELATAIQKSIEIAKSYRNKNSF